MGLSTEMRAHDQAAHDDEFAWAKQHALDVAEEDARTSPWAGILDEFGTVDAWHAACRERRGTDTERQLSRAVLRLMSDSVTKPRGTLRTPERNKLLADRPLAAYWLSVAAAGSDGWSEERARIADVGVRGLLPVWRAWGQVLLDANVVGNLDEAFSPPG